MTQINRGQLKNYMMSISNRIILSAFIAISVLACKQYDTSQTTNKNNSTDSVVVFLLHKDSINKQIKFPAELIPLERAEIFAKVTGYISSLKVDIGDKVTQGQVIAVLDAPEMIANVAQSNADVQTARSKYLGSLDAYKRISNAEKVEGTIAAGELEKAKTRMLADSASLEAARSKTNAFTRIKDYLVLRAPFNGIITQRNADPGTLVNAGNTKPLLVVENTSTLRLRIPVPEAYTSTTANSTMISFTVDAQPDVTYQAKLSRKAGALNLSNRTETWEFLYDNKNGQLKSGMFASSVLKLGRDKTGFMIPQSAIATTLERKFIIRLKSDKTEWVDIRSGFSQDDKVEIFGNIHDDDTLLLRATDEIKPGTKLIPKFLK